MPHATHIFKPAEGGLVTLRFYVSLGHGHAGYR